MKGRSSSHRSLETALSELLTPSSKKSLYDRCVDGQEDASERKQAADLISSCKYGLCYSVTLKKVTRPVMIPFMFSKAMKKYYVLVHLQKQ